MAIWWPFTEPGGKAAPLHYQTIITAGANGVPLDNITIKIITQRRQKWWNLICTTNFYTIFHNTIFIKIYFQLQFSQRSNRGSKISWYKPLAICKHRSPRPRKLYREVFWNSWTADHPSHPFGSSDEEFIDPIIFFKYTLIL